MTKNKKNVDTDVEWRKATEKWKSEIKLLFLI